MAESSKAALNKIELAETDDFLLLGRNLESYFLIVKLNRISLFSVRFLKELKNSLCELETHWGILVTCPEFGGEVEVLAAIYSVAIAEGGDNEIINAIIAEADASI